MRSCLKARTDLVGLFLCLFFMPWVLAPVYYQGGTAPSVGEASVPLAVGGLPAAAALESPLLVTPSLAVEAPMEVSASVEVSSSQDVAPAPQKPLRVANVEVCVRGLATVQDMAAVAYQQRASAAYMAVLVAAGIARQQVLDGFVPSLTSLQKRVHALPINGLLRRELAQGVVMVGVACRGVR